MNYYLSSLKKAFLIVLLILISNNIMLSANARLKNKEDANKFLDEYCIEIVNAIKEAYEKQIIAIENEDLRKFGEQGHWIGGLSDVYSKLCKK